MPTAFVLITTEVGSEAEVLKDLRQVEGVEEAFKVDGVFDIIVRVKADTMNQLKEVVTWHIQKLNNVRTTLTILLVEESRKARA
jgi:DNA-binding Lrp family transcriptional regulator